MNATERFHNEWIESKRFKALCDKFESILGYRTMASPKTSDLDACIWFCTHMDDIKAGTIPRKTVDAFGERFDLNFKKYPDGEHWLQPNGTPFGQLGYLDGKFFKTLLTAGFILDKNNPRSGGNGCIVGCGDLVSESNNSGFQLTDISNCKLYWNNDYNLLAIKDCHLTYSSDATRLFYAKGTFENRCVDEKVDSIFNFCESVFKPNSEKDNENAVRTLTELIDFVEQDKDDLAVYLIDWYLRYKMQNLHNTHLSLNTPSALEHMVTNALTAIYGMHRATKIMSLYYLTGNTKQATSYIRNENVEVTTSTLPELF